MMSETKAASAVFISAGGTTVSWLSTASAIVQLIAGIVAILSGIAATYYYIRKATR